MVREGSFIVVMFLFYLLQHFTSSTTESESKTRGKQAKGSFSFIFTYKVNGLFQFTLRFLLLQTQKKNSNTQTIG